MTTHSLSTMLLVAVIAVLSPPLADLAGRKAPVPLVVFEIVLGILVGPDVLGWAHDDDYVHALSQFGLAMLFFMAGYEIDFDRLRGGPLSRALLGWASSVAIGVGLATGGGAVGEERRDRRHRAEHHRAGHDPAGAAGRGRGRHPAGAPS